MRAAIEALALEPTTVWTKAIGAEDAKGSEVAETMFAFAGRDLRLIVCRQPTRPGDQLTRLRQNSGLLERPQRCDLHVCRLTRGPRAEM